MSCLRSASPAVVLQDARKVDHFSPLHRYAESRLDSLKAKIASIYARQFEVAAATLQSGVGDAGRFRPLPAPG